MTVAELLAELSLAPRASNVLIGSEPVATVEWTSEDSDVTLSGPPAEEPPAVPTTVNTGSLPEA